MGFLDHFFNKNETAGRAGAIPGGKQKRDGSHDHRTNTGNNRTPAQLAGDKKRRK